MYTKCPMTKLVKNYQLFTFWWFKSLYAALTNMSTFMFHDLLSYHITMGNDVNRVVHYAIIMGHDVVMATYDVTMHTDVTRTFIYYVLLRPIMTFLFSK